MRIGERMTTLPPLAGRGTTTVSRDFNSEFDGGTKSADQILALSDASDTKRVRHYAANFRFT